MKDERQSIDCDVVCSFLAVPMPHQCAKLFLMLPVLQVSVTAEVLCQVIDAVGIINH